MKNKYNVQKCFIVDQIRVKFVEYAFKLRKLLLKA